MKYVIMSTSTLCTLALFSIVTICHGQSETDCTKYCHQSCSDYFPGSEFSTCVNSNINCNCGLNPVARTVLFIIGIAIFFIIVGICYRMCRRKCNSGNYTQYPPVVSHVPAPTTQSNVISPGGYSTGVPPYPQHGINRYYNQTQTPASAPPQHMITTVGHMDPPPPYGQAIIAPPDPELPSYTSKYSTYK